MSPAPTPAIRPRHEWHPIASGVELHCVHWDPPTDAPEGARWLLVHGLASNARLWDGVASHLAIRGHTVVAVDQRGHGRSSKPDEGYDLVTVSDDLVLLLDALDWDTAALAGQSWGGNVVLEAAYRHPRRAAVIACVDGGFIDLGARFPDWDDAARVLAPPRLAGTPLAEMTTWIERSAADWPAEGRAGTMANFQVRDDGTIAPWLTFDRHLMVLRGLWEHQPSTRYPHLTVPTLLIAADTGDVAWSHSKHDAVEAALAALPRGRAEWFRPAHHDVHAQHPDEVGALLHRAVADPDFFPPATSRETTDR
jgi:pimeloyl-ACP methyl ester carboxylesterase